MYTNLNLKVKVLAWKFKLNRFILFIFLFSLVQFFFVLQVKLLLKIITRFIKILTSKYDAVKF